MMTPRLGCARLALVLLFSCSALQVQASPDAEAPPAFILRHVPTGFRHDIPSPRRATEVAFKHEPAYAGGTVYRHALRTGSEPTDFIGIAYDVAANMLYIDRNRNLDLTDDGPGISGGRPNYMGFGIGRFSDVRIEVEHDGIVVPYVLDITIFGDFYASFTVTSGWKGEVEIAGKSGEMGVVDTLDGVFDENNGFLFDHEKHRAARLSFGEATVLSLPRWLYFEGQSYTVACAFCVMEDEPVVAVTLTPITEDLMDITFEGQSVSHVVLSSRDNGYGLLDWPVPAMRIPRGVYKPSQVELLDSFTGYPRRPANLEADGNTRLQAGGPLRQEVLVVRSGLYLHMNYALLGVDATEYSPNRSDEPPGFAVYRDDTRLASGNFEYG